MVEIDLTNVIIPLIVGIIVPFIIIFLSKFGKTSEGTLTGTIRLEGLKSNVDEVRETMDRGFTKVEGLLNARETEMRLEFTKTREILNQLAGKISLSEYRLDRLERERGWQGGAYEANRRQKSENGKD